MLNLKFTETHNLVAFLEKPEESDGFEGIIDFLNASSIKYALTVNPTIYTSCVKQFWATAKRNTVTGDAVTIISRWEEELERMGYENLTQKLTFYKAFFSPQWKFLIHTILQCLSAKTTAWNEFSSTMASVIICFSGRVTPLFQTMMVQAPKELRDGSKVPTNPQHAPTIIQPSTSQPQKKQPRRKQRKDTEVPQPSGSTKPITDEAANEEHVPTYSNDPLLSVLDLENTKTSQAAEITKLKERVKKLERMNKSRTIGLKRLRKVGRSAQVISSEDEEVTLVDEAQRRNDDNLMFNTGVLDEHEVKVEKVVSTAKVTIVSATTTTVDELTLTQTLIEIKAAKPKAVTTAATTTITTVTRPKARGVVVQEPNQILIDEEIAQKLQAQLNVELEEEEKLAKQREEDANIVEWDNVQAMIDADYEIAARLQVQEHEELTVEEKSKLFVELMDKRKKHFARLRAKEQRRKPPTKAQKRNQICTYLENMVGFTHSQLKNKSFDEVQKAFDKTMGWIDSFVSMDSEVVKGEQERIKKQNIDDDQEEAKMKKHMEIVVDEEEIAVDVIPLATKPPIIVDWKIIKEGKMGYFQIIRADGSSRKYSSMIKMLQNIDKEDLETLWKLVKAKHGS
ncbi:hypothetical protein Tco_0856816 [Tanacetum coccineum]|uniref:Uncharacterized protein n=1 Tax=Tanacetum coccineum TaxID=301880 RepID=A0ABQ5BA27_9ASTR